MNHKELKATSWSIDNKTTIYLFTFFICLAGLITYNNLPKVRFPDIVIPKIFISTIYPGTSPSDIETLITKPLEKQLKSVKGVKKITSQSIQDASIIVVEFQSGIEVPLAKTRTKDAVDKAKTDLPNDLDRDPGIQEVDLNEQPIMNINLAGDYPQEKLKKYAEDFQDRIEALPQITRVDIIGALDREIQVNVDMYRLQAAGFSFGDIEQAIGSQNVNISGGDLNVNGVRRTLRVAGEFKSINSLKDVVIRNMRGNAVKLSEVAQINDAFAERLNYARLDNKPVISLNVIKRGGENLIEASDKIEEIVAEMKKDKLPDGLRISITGDQSEETRTSLSDLINSVVIGFVFVVLVLMFFMGTTNAIFVGLSVPISMLLAFLFLPQLGFTLNIITLFSFLLALGIVVDDAIVVIENTHRIFHHNPKEGVVKAAKMAAGEVFVPVLSGTLTTIAPFFPLIFWPGIVGEFMLFLPVTLIITLFASLFVAFIMNPVFAVSFMKSDEETKASNVGIRQHLRPVIIMGILTILGYAINYGLGNFMIFFIVLYFMNHYLFNPVIRAFQENVLPRFMNGYRAILHWVIVGSRPGLFILGSFALLIFTGWLFKVAGPKIDFFPKSEPKFVFIYNQMPIGTDAKVTDSITRVIEKRVYEVIGQNNPMVKSVISNVGIGAGDPQNPDRVVTPHKSKVTVAFVDFSERNGKSTSEVLEKIRTKMVGIPGAEISVEQEAAGPPVGKPINIEISGEEFPQLTALSSELKSRIQQSGIKGIEELKSDLQLNKPEIVVDIDKEKAQRMGITTAAIGMQVRTALYGKEVSRYREAKDDYPIMVRYQELNRASIDNLLAMNITYMDMASGGIRSIPLSSVASVRNATNYSSINRRDQNRVVSLSSNVIQGYTANDIIPKIQELVKDMNVPEGYIIRFTGEQQDQAETSNFLGYAFASAMMLILMILVVQFNSISKPLIILFTVVLSLIGVLLGFIIFKMNFSIVITGIGIIALAGIVVKNGILLIEFTDELRSRGYPLREAIVEAGATRLTPVILTASAAVLGLIPLATGVNIDFGSLFTNGDPKFFMGGDTASFWGPLAWAIIYGLTFCTFLTLVIVPAQYWAVERIKAYVGKKKFNPDGSPVEDDAHSKVITEEII